jgi:hypothetical protein
MMQKGDGSFFILFGMVLGIVIGSLFSSGITMVILDDPINQIDEVISECEKTLPRNQHCILTAIPEELKNDQ